MCHRIRYQLHVGRWWHRSSCVDDSVNEDSLRQTRAKERFGPRSLPVESPVEPLCTKSLFKSDQDIQLCKKRANE